MRVLYVTPCWSALRDLLFGESSTPRGMPAFFRPLERLLAEGHTVDFVVGADATGLAETPRLFGRTARVETVRWASRGLARPASIARATRLVANRLGAGEYDFVYGHGAMGVVGCWAAQRRGIRTGLRLYGVNKYPEAAKRLPPWRFACLHPLQHQAFRGRKDFLLATDDGSRADEMLARLSGGHYPFNFHFWRNGFDRPPSLTSPPPPREPVLFCPGRIATKKRQHLCVELLGRLHLAGSTNVRLVMAGHLNDRLYFDQVMRRAAELGVEHAVEYAGVLRHGEMLERYRRCLAVVSWQKVSNLSNVCIEALSVGAAVVAPNDGSLDGVVEDNASAILARDIEDAANRVAALADDCRARQRIGTSAQAAVRLAFKSWDERASDEAALVIGDASQEARAA